MCATKRNQPVQLAVTYKLGINNRRLKQLLTNAIPNYRAF